MSNNQNTNFAEQRKEILEEKLEVFEEKEIEGRTIGGYGLKRVMSLSDELDRLNRGIFA